MELEELYIKHRQLKFPEFPQDDDFAEWLEELIELDAYYVGIISSSLGGSIPNPNISTKDIHNLSISLNDFKSVEDYEIFKKCQIYVESLQNLINKAIR